MLCFFNFLNAQTRTIDSLKNILKFSGEDTNKVITLNLIGWHLARFGEYQASDATAQNALALAQKINFKRGCAKAYNTMGMVAYFQGNYPDGLKHYFACLKISEKLNDKKSIASCLNNIGEIYRFQGNFSEALKNHFESLKIKEELNNLEGTAVSWTNIGIIYGNLNDNEKALESFHAALNIVNKLGQKSKAASILVNMANVYDTQNKIDTAIKINLEALKIMLEDNDLPGVSAIYVNVGNLNIKLKNFKAAEMYLKKGLSVSLLAGIKENTATSYEGLYLLFLHKKDYKMAFENYKNYISYRDSIVSEENTKKTVQAQMNYEFDKKEAATKLEQEKKDTIAHEEKQKQTIIRNAFIGGFVLVLLLALFIFRSYRNKQKANIIITKQKEEVEKAKETIEEQKNLVEEKQKEILDSIHYALRIQKALMTNEKYIEKNLTRLAKT